MRERGLKLMKTSVDFLLGSVAPVRERGLKLVQLGNKAIETRSRSREGAWIEIEQGAKCRATADSRSREGAWIEIMLIVKALVCRMSLP